MLPQPGFLERLRELATKHGTVLVFDEVITGFRHGLGGYGAIAGVTPDLITLGLNLKRSHFSYAHTDDDVGRLLEATEASGRAFPAGRSA